MTLHLNRSSIEVSAAWERGDLSRPSNRDPQCLVLACARVVPYGGSGWLAHPVDELAEQPYELAAGSGDLVR